MMKRVFTAAGTLLALMLAGAELDKGGVTFDFKKISGAQELPEQIEPRQPRKIVIGTAPELTMVKDGKVNFEIVVPSDAAPSVKFAGKEAAELLGKAFDTELKVRKTASGKCPAIILGSPKYAAELDVDLEKLDRDGFVIRTFPGGVLIAGRDDPKKDERSLLSDHATIFGTYDFLERFAGMRFYKTGDFGTIIPKRQEWTLPAIDIYDRPDFYLRRYSDWGDAKPGDRAAAAIRLKTRLRNRWNTRHFYNCHSLRDLNYGNRFGKTHPEYFALQSNGRRVIDTHYTGTGHWDESHYCYSSKIKDEVIADIISYLKGEPAEVRGVIDRTTRKIGWFKGSFPKGGKFFSLCLPDGVKPCTCPACASETVNGTKRQLQEHYWRFFHDVAQAVKESGISGWLVVPCNYGAWRGMPTDQEIPDNVILQYFMRGEWNELNPRPRDREFAQLKAWAEKTHKKFLLWTYPGKYYGEFPGIPTATPHYAASFFNRVKPYVLGCYFESHTDCSFSDYLIRYVYGKILWNSETDVEQLMNEHTQLMFGPAATLMKEYFDSIERNWMKIASHSVDTSIGPVTKFPSEIEMWNTIYTKAERDRISALFAQAEKLTAGDPQQLERVRTLRRESWEPVLKAASKFSGQTEAIAQWGAYMPKVDKAPVIDGNPDDPVWKQAEAITLIPQKFPVEVRTTVRALRDKENFYFAFDCEESETQKCEPHELDNPDLWRDPCVEIFLSPDRKPDRCYQIIVNAAGSIADAVNKGVRDWSWNSQAEAKSVVTPGKGWTVEIKVPRNSMDPAAESGMLANFTRRYFPPKRKPCYSLWGPFYTKEHSEIEHFGTLRFRPDDRADLIRDGDFDKEPGKKHPNFLGKWFWNGEDKTFPTATEYLIKGKYSALLDSSRIGGKHGSCSVNQYLSLKPDTEYELSFFVRMEKVKPAEAKSSGFYVRVDDRSRKEMCFPHRSSAALSGSLPWTPMFFRFKTSPNDDGKKPKVAFVLRKAEGKVWIDHVRLFEVKK